MQESKWKKFKNEFWEYIIIILVIALIAFFTIYSQMHSSGDNYEPDYCDLNRCGR